MPEHNQSNPMNPPGRTLRCDECEDLIADALDGALSPADAAAFARHQAECPSCAQMLRETQQGRDWLKYLAPEPAVPADLLERILARTSGTAQQTGTDGVAAPAQPIPARRRLNVPAAFHAARQLARMAVEPRLMMTVAMAFFSIALTLNLTGINLGQIRPGDLAPSHLRATLTRQYYATNEQVTRYYLNLRVVYEMEARVRELRRSTESEPASFGGSRPSSNGTPANPAQPDNNRPAKPTGGSPSSTLPTGELPDSPVHTENNILLPVNFLLTLKGHQHIDRQKHGRNEVFRAPRSTAENQAERSLV